MDLVQLDKVVEGLSAYNDSLGNILRSSLLGWGWVGDPTGGKVFLHLDKNMLQSDLNKV